ncbi:MAG: sodium-translocating pyrophosphatase [Myxococcota bacterium]
MPLPLNPRRFAAAIASVMALCASGTAFASEADLVMPNLANPNVTFIGGLDGWTLLLLGLLVCFGGLGFGAFMYVRVRNLPVHDSMREISELIFETCKTYLLTQGRFILILEALIGSIIALYFGFIAPLESGLPGVLLVLLFSLIGIGGSYGVAWFGIRVNTFANSRAAFASLRGKPFPTYDIPLMSGMSIGMMLISVELVLMLMILLFVPGHLAGACFIGFAIGESLGASALRIAGGIFTKIADIGSDLMKIVFNIKEDDARNPGVIADCTGDNAGDSVGPTADGFETYGVTGVALITFILLGVSVAGNDVATEIIRVQLLVWIFVMRVMMVVTSALSYGLVSTWARGRYQNADHMDFEQPLTVLVWVTSVISILSTYLISFLLIPTLNGDTTLWWKLSTIISCGTLAGAVIPEFVKVFTSTSSSHVKEVVTASREGGASLNILAGLTAGNFSAYWLGLVIVGLMSVGYFVSTNPLGSADAGLTHLMTSPAVFAFGLIAFGFLGMGPVTIAVDSYGPVTDNAQSVYELSLIETIPNIEAEIQQKFGFKPDFEKGKHFLEENDGAGNTFKATAKPVLIGTAVVGATTLIFSIIVALGHVMGEAVVTANLSILHPPFLLGLITGGAVIYWFSGASTQAVSTGAYRAVEFIKANIKLDTAVGAKASTEDSKKVVEICTIYAQRGMFNIFLVIFFSTLGFALIEPFFFIGYLISIAIFGLYQAIFMANAGGAWDNAKKLVEVDLKEKGTPLHAACVVGDTVGDPFKDTSSVAMNPIIKFTTLFGLLAVEMGVGMPPELDGLKMALAAGFVLLSMVFVWRSFYGMRIKSDQPDAAAPASGAVANAK